MMQTPYRALDLILANEKDEFLSYYPEYSDIVLQVERNLDAWIKKCRDAIHDVEDQTCITDQKSLAAYVMKNYKDIAAVIFRYCKVEDDDRSLDQWILDCFKSFPRSRKISIITKKAAE